MRPGGHVHDRGVLIVAALRTGSPGTSGWPPALAIVVRCDDCCISRIPAAGDCPERKHGHTMQPHHPAVPSDSGWSSRARSWPLFPISLQVRGEDEPQGMALPDRPGPRVTPIFAKRCRALRAWKPVHGYPKGQGIHDNLPPAAAAESPC
ncbi:hypothetical protein TOPH_06058 [Tolypocladium ophioglossoides CBS 100239]|uniref:Uncharacterized protein n=1 Tax=Tolypocladium ophioglossoides (strain CBS 100239) TaxID=1163406 RepID=A0A0L0N6C5_TOLOC|nr:hypothetical protein TOPH_06058 [Tolypocladium ophioglossoides CBS 100239]